MIKTYRRCDADAAALSGRLAALEQPLPRRLTTSGPRRHRRPPRPAFDQAPPSASGKPCRTRVPRRAPRSGACQHGQRTGGCTATTAAAPVPTGSHRSRRGSTRRSDHRVSHRRRRAPAFRRPLRGNASAAAVAARFRRALDAGAPYCRRVPKVIAALMPATRHWAASVPPPSAGIATREVLAPNSARWAMPSCRLRRPPTIVLGRLVAQRPRAGQRAVRRGRSPATIRPRSRHAMEAAVGKRRLPAAAPPRARDALPPTWQAGIGGLAGRAAARVTADTLFAEPPTATGVVNR